MGVLLGGCDDRAGANKVLDRIERMRDAPIGERQAAIDALAALSVDHDKARAAQTACLDAYRKLQEAHKVTEAARARVDEQVALGGKPRVEEVAAADRAVTLMLEAKKAEPACIAAAAALRRALR